MVAVAYGSADKVPLAGGTMTGALVLAGSPPARIASGAVAGDVLVSDASGNLSWDQPRVDWLNAKAAAYGALGNGVHDDTTAILAALSAAGAAPNGGTVYLPAGTYVYNSDLVFNNGTTGYKNVRVVGAGPGATILKRGTAGAAISMSGPATDVSAATHCEFCTLENLQINGNGLSGAVLKTYYADNLAFRDVKFTNSSSILHDTAEFWDSRFWGCHFETAGSSTGGATAPMVWLRNSAASSGFGFSADSTNQIHYVGCRWEGFKTGAVRIEQGVNNTGGPNSLYFTNCKIETSTLNGGPHVYADANTRALYMEHIYLFSGAFQGGFSTAQDLITSSAQFATFEDITMSNGGTATVASGITVNSPTAGDTVVVSNITATWGTAPTGALLNIGTMTGWIAYGNLLANIGALLAGGQPNLPGNSPVVSTTTIANTTSTSTLQSYSVPANEPWAGAVYEMRGYGFYSVTGTPTLTFSVFWAATGVVNLPAITATSGISNAGFDYELTLTFRSATSVWAKLRVTLETNTTTGASTTYTIVTTSAVTVVSNIARTLALAFAWSAASASNTISLVGGRTVKAA